MQRTSQWQRLPPALIAVIVAAVALALASPLFMAPMAPLLVVVGIASLRRASDPLVRGLAWGAIVTGVVLLTLVAFVLLGLGAVGVEGAVEGPIESVGSPWPIPPTTP